MRDNRLLYVAGWYLENGLHHASRHWAEYLKGRFRHVDVVGFNNFYSGPPASAWHKVRRGVADLARHRVEISGDDATRRILIRDLYAPPPFKWLAKELWRYAHLRRVLAASYDLAIIGDPENAWLLWLLKRSGRIKRLIFQDWDYHPGLMPTWLSRQALERRERLCVRQADAVITGNNLLAQLRMEQGARQVLVVPYGVDLTLFASGRQKVPHPPTLVYLGSLSPLWGIDLAIRAMPALSRAIPEVRLVIAGLGPAEDELKALSQQLNVAGRVIFLGHLPYQDLPGVLAAADVGVLTSLPSSKFRHYATPVKLINYLAAGLPVIATRMGQQGLTMEEANAGLLIDYSTDDFVEAAIKLLSDRPFYDRCAQAAVVYASHFDWTALLDQAREHLIRMIDHDRLSDSALTLWLPPGGSLAQA